jgi:hypothetical protein
MISVDEIDVSISRRAKEHSVAKRPTYGGMGGGIVLSEVGFDFDDPGSEAFSVRLANEHLAKEFTGYAARIAGVEIAVERTDRLWAQRGFPLQHTEVW